MSGDYSECELSCLISKVLITSIPILNPPNILKKICVNYLLLTQVSARRSDSQVTVRVNNYRDSEMQNLQIAITKKQSPTTQHQNRNYLETVSAIIVLHVIQSSLALKTCMAQLSNPTSLSFKQDFVHNCIILEHVPMRFQILLTDLERDLKSQLTLCCKSDAI